jgi:general secretion pathway protein G
MNERVVAQHRQTRRGQRLLSARGFTMVEMLVVVAMVSIVAMAVLPLAEVSNSRAKERELRQALWQIREAIDRYKRLSDQGGTAETPTRSGYPPNLGALVSLQPGAQGQRLLRRLPRDPFAPDGLPAEQAWGLRSFSSSAQAPRAGEDVYDVFSLSTRMGSNGIPLQQW